MTKKIQIEQSGISLVDKTWGGFYRGGTYLLVGPKKSGRTLLGLHYAMEAARQKQVCLYFTGMRPKELLIHAASMDFDLEHYMNQNLIVVVRVALPFDHYGSGSPDEYLMEDMNDILEVIKDVSPAKIVFDELTPFVSFRDLGLLNEVYANLTEPVEDEGITSLFILSEPATPAAKGIIDTIAGSSTGIIKLKKKETESKRLYGGIITITPHIGHTEGEYTGNYLIEPNKGVTSELRNDTVAA